MTWTLVICIGVSWAGCGSANVVRGLTLEQCTQATSAAKVDGVNSVAYCRPKAVSSEADDDRTEAQP